MKNERIQAILQKKEEIFNENDAIQRGSRGGIELDKGVVLTEEYLVKNYDHITKLLQYYTAYPDMYLDAIKPADSNFQLFFYQRICLRALMRFKDIFITAPRAFSKSFITILGLILQCIFIPGTKRFICAPNKNQSAQIAKEKITEIYDRWPLLRKEVVGGDISDTPGNFGKDYVTLKFRNGSQFDVVGALDSQRGGRRHGGLIDEVRDHEEEPINNIVLPLMNVSRRLPNNEINPKEPNQERIFMTSAGSKVSFAYDLLLDVFEESIIHPDTAFCFGCDYRVPVMHGLLDRNYVNKMKTSPSYSEDSFAREYLSIWLGSSDESWFNFDKLQKHRLLKNPETHKKNIPNADYYYLISVDVGRLNDQTVATVFRVHVNGQGNHRANVVNIFVLAREAATKTFTKQAIDIKKLIAAFDPKEVVIDTNGLGIGLADEMIKPHFDEYGEYYPPYGFFNDPEYAKIQPASARRILYGLKASSAALNSKIHSNVYARINSGAVIFLISDQEAKNALMATKTGQKMTEIQRIKRLMPHEMTSKLFEEMANLRLKKTGNGTDVVLEQINSRYPKDKYSSLAYGLWRIKEHEEEYQRRNRRYCGDAPARNLLFFD